MTESEILDDRLDQTDKVFLMPMQVKGQYPQQNKTQNLEVKHLESDVSESQGRILKNSLLSSNAQESNLNDFDKDTVYSFFAEESEIIPRRQKRAGHRDLERNNRQNQAKKTNVDEEQTSFIASQSPKDYKRKPRNQTQANEKFEEEDILAKTKTQLKTERIRNREQSDELKRMQAQIDILTHKWSITEN